MRVPVTPDGDGIVSVRHCLGTRELVVRCLCTNGSRVGYLMANSIDDDEVEIATLPGSGVAMVEVEPFFAGESHG